MSLWLRTQVNYAIYLIENYYNIRSFRFIKLYKKSDHCMYVYPWLNEVWQFCGSAGTPVPDLDVVR